MSQPPLLALPDFALPFTLDTDACATGLGAVLMQNSRTLSYFRKCLGPNTSAKSVYEKEAMAILEALKKWRHYFLGNQLIIKTIRVVSSIWQAKDYLKVFNTFSC
jgi:hypothetical protein